MRITRSLAMGMALLLCGSQLAAAQHGINHLVAPPDHACTQCLHQPGQKHALPLWVSADLLGKPAFEVLPAAVPSPGSGFRHSCQPRAPPISLR